MRIVELSAVGAEVLQARGTAVVGLSIRNNYFRGDTIERLTQWGGSSFGKLVFMVPDEPAIDTLLGLGNTHQKARAKAMLACNNLANKCARAIVRFGISDRSTIIRWAQLTGNETYLASLTNILRLYACDELFSNDVREMTRQVMLNQNTTLPIHDAIELGAGFILKELSFIVAASEILECSGPSVYVYHRPTAILKNLLCGKYSSAPASACGYMVCELEHLTASEPRALSLPTAAPRQRTENTAQATLKSLVP